MIATTDIETIEVLSDFRVNERNKRCSGRGTKRQKRKNIRRVEGRIRILKEGE